MSISKLCLLIKMCICGMIGGGDIYLVSLFFSNIKFAFIMVL